MVAKVIHNPLIELRKDVNRKEIIENKNSEKTADIVENILIFNNQQKDKGHPSDLAHIACVAKICDHSRIKTLTPKQMLQRLPVALPQVKAGKSFENLLNKICQLIYSLYQAK